MAFTEFYCDFATGANINAGDGAATVSTTTNGAYTQGGGAGGTDLFTATGGTPFSTAAVGDFVSVYNDAATVTTFVGRITAINSGGLSVDISLTALSGTRPATAANGKSATIGGVWKGPNAASGFPFGFAAPAMKNVAGNPPRVNFKNTSTYAVTAAMTANVAGPVFYQGYTATAGDGGKATIDGGTSGNYYVLLTVSAVNQGFRDLIFAHHGASSTTQDGVVISSAECSFIRCVFHDFTKSGAHCSAITSFVECEAYACNSSNAANNGGIFVTISGTSMIRCISHDNVGGANVNGYQADGGVLIYHCIGESNSGNGISSTGDVTQFQYGCDFYNNTRSGIFFQHPDDMLLTTQNCNFTKNGRYGFEISTGFGCNGTFYNNGFGTGTEANGLGTFTIPGIDVLGTVTYATDASPWVDAPNGDFRITLATAKGAGRGSFTETAASYAGTVGYPDIGAAQHL